MKKLLMAGISLLALAYCIAQTSPVEWVFAHWHIYSQTTPDGGPLPTKISFTKNPLVTLESSAQEKGKLIKKFEEVFDVNVIYFDRDAEHVQCLPPSQVPFQIEVN